MESKVMSYEDAMNEAAKHHCHMMPCFDEKDLETAMFAKAVMISMIYGKDYDVTLRTLYVLVDAFDSSRRMWYDAYLKEHAEEMEG